MANEEHFPRRYQVGDLIIDLDAYSVRRGDKAISLTRKSFDLLAALVRKAPQVLTHDELLAEAWGDIVVSDDALKQRIKVLRQSLGDASDAPRYVESVRGIGYRLVPPVQVLTTDAGAGAISRSRVARFAAGFVAVVAIFVFVHFSRDTVDKESEGSLSARLPLRVAVLPFRDLSEESDKAWFAAGVTEDIITRLSSSSDLLVLSSTTTALYAGSSKSLREIATELDVLLVLEGSVRLDEDRVRINSQLIDAETDTHVWAHDYDQDLEDIFSIQRDVAERIAKALRLEVSALVANGDGRPPTDSLEAYEYFLRGREAYARYRRRDNETAIELYTEALRLDPNFALAKAELATVYALRTINYGFAAADSATAMELAESALEQNPQLPEAIKARGLAFAVSGRLAEARDAYLRAVRLRPSYQAAVHNLAVINRTLGKLDEALEWGQRAVALDPASLLSAEYYGLTLLELGFLDEADRWFDALARREPLANRVQLYRMTTALMVDDVNAARQVTERLVAAAPDCALCLSRAAIIASLAGDDVAASAMFRRLQELSPNFRIYALLQLGRIGLDSGRITEDAGRYDEALAHLERAESIAQRAINSGHENPVFAWYLAGVHAVRGEVDESLAWLERAVDAGRQDFAWDRIEPALSTVRSEPRFLALVERTRSQVAAMRERARANGWHLAEPPSFP